MAAEARVDGFEQTVTSPDSSPSSYNDLQDNVHLDPRWKVLGPFQMGTREAIWGCDPLAARGGFSTLEFDHGAAYASSLSHDGSVGWSDHHYEPLPKQSGALVSVDLSFPNIDWVSIKDCYGWAAVQYQAWARGNFCLSTRRPRRVAIYCEQIFELAIDGQNYFGGDLFTFRRAPIIVKLSPGQHVVDLRLIRDARAMGGAAEIPSIQATLELYLPSHDVRIDQTYANLPDIVSGIFCSRYGSIPVENYLDDAIEVVAVESRYDNIIRIRDIDTTIHPGQSRPINLILAVQSVTEMTLELELTYRVKNKEGANKVKTELSLKISSQEEPHKFTFLHPSGTVSYAIIRPPPLSMNHSGTNSPVLVNLHGAGLDANSLQLKMSLKDVEDLPAWFLFPSGTTSWSGDDWHHWGWRDVEAAILAISEWSAHNEWKGASASLDRIMVVGHSNGGQGTFYALSHWPDRIIAAASASGYMSIQSYVPYQLWREMEPLRMSVIHAAMNGARHELLVSNFRNVPIYLQHGDSDGNVPVFHSRRMFQLLKEQRIAVAYSEHKDKGHWWPGALVTPGLREFYHTHLQRAALTTSLQEFSFVVATPADTGSKHGLKIELLKMPGQLGKIDMVKIEDHFNLSTSNVQQVSFPKVWLKEQRLTVDNKRLKDPDTDIDSDVVLVSLDSHGTWTVLDGVTITDPSKSARKLGGGLHAILRTSGLLTLVANGVAAHEVALNIARNLYQYYAANVAIVSSPKEVTDQNGNVITVALGSSLEPGFFSDYPIKVESGNLTMRKPDGLTKIYSSDLDGLGAAFLRPWVHGRLELVVWGSDSDTLQLASRLVPTVTGAGQPDFVIQNNDSLWKGADGALALGFFDSQWNITASSYIM